MVVIVAGMYRSGSTFVFNVVQDILEADGPVVTDSANGLKRFTQDIGKAKHAIIKAHAPNFMVQNAIRAGAFRCIASYRNPEEAIASWKAAFGFPLEDSIRTIQGWIDWHSGFRPLVKGIPYRAIDKHPYLTILRIQFWLKGWISPVRAFYTFLRLRKGKLMKDLAQLEKNGATTDVGFPTTRPNRCSIEGISPRSTLGVLGRCSPLTRSGKSRKPANRTGRTTGNWSPFGFIADR